MKICSIALDPIEKKPLARYMPGSMVLSVGGLGCTMHCPWCQNHDIAQPVDPHAVPTRDITANELVELAQSYASRGNVGVAYTYNEPLLHWRDVLECSRAVHDAGLVNVLVTNGLIASDKLEQLLPYIDAFNIDVKGFDQRVYDICGGKLKTVQAAVELAHKTSHVELTTLLIPGINDNMDELEDEARWIAGIDPDIPLHITRFFPRFKYSDKAPTPLETLYTAKHVASKYLNHVFLGNV